MTSSSQNFYYTNVQAQSCVRLAQNITCFYQLPIHIVRLDERTKNIFVLFGEDIAVSVLKDGIWRFEP
ncbi:MAG: hypothetical protein AAF063_17560 [Cyanobacteria bacterium J06643_5]